LTSTARTGCMCTMVYPGWYRVVYTGWYRVVYIPGWCTYRGVHTRVVYLPGVP